MKPSVSPRRTAASFGLLIVLLTGCSSAQEIAIDSQTDSQIDSQALEEVSPAADRAPVAPAPEAPSNDLTAAESTDVPAAAPQLVKQANLTLRVDEVEASLDAISAIARAQQGDVLNLEGSGGSSNQRATVRLRIPQDRLEAALEAIAELGQVTQRRISAEDVSTQLVDLEARLRNLRKTEAMLLGIMERSGDVGDVLQVAQEVSQVRASIEQLDAQQQQLRNRVRYATVTVALDPQVTSPTPPAAIRDELGQTWQQATASFRNASVGLMKLALWLLVYSPYLGILVLIGLGLYHLRRRTGANRA